MFKLSFVIPLPLLLLLPACASIIDGTEQSIAIQSTPTEADCRLLREGAVVASITTLGQVVIEKTKHDLTLECQKDGYEVTTVILESGIEGATWGNIALLGGVGWAFDSATGADNKYPDYVNLKLIPKPVNTTGLLTTGQAAFDGTALGGDERWVGRAAEDACGSGWSMDLQILGSDLVGTVWRDDVEYAVRGSVDTQGEVIKARAAKKPAFENVPAARFLAINLSFNGNQAHGQYGIDTYGRMDCVSVVVLSRLNSNSPIKKSDDGS